MKGRRTGETQGASPKGLRLEPDVLEPNYETVGTC